MGKTKQITKVQVLTSKVLLGGGNKFLFLSLNLVFFHEQWNTFLTKTLVRQQVIPGVKSPAFSQLLSFLGMLSNQKAIDSSGLVFSLMKVKL